MSKASSGKEEEMKLSLKSMALAAGILWAFVLLMTGVCNLIWPRYGEAFLKLMASVYPGYHATNSVGDLIIGTLCALIDGAVCGLAFGWLYNIFIGKKSFPRSQGIQYQLCERISEKAPNGSELYHNGRGKKYQPERTLR
jgi:ABC-type phosphate transport system permease subunit